MFGERGGKLNAKKGGGEKKKKVNVCRYVGKGETGQDWGVREGFYKQSSQLMMLTPMSLFCFFSGWSCFGPNLWFIEKEEGERKEAPKRGFSSSDQTRWLGRWYLYMLHTCAFRICTYIQVRTWVGLVVLAWERKCTSYVSLYSQMEKISRPANLLQLFPVSPLNFG